MVNKYDDDLDRLSRFCRAHGHEQHTDRRSRTRRNICSNHRRTGHFLEGAESILPEKYGTAPEKWTPELTWLNRTRQESLTTSIVENRWRTNIYIVLLSSIFVKHALNSHFVKYIGLLSFFGRCPKNCSIARKKLFCPTLGAAPSSYAYGSNSQKLVQSANDCYSAHALN